MYFLFGLFFSLQVSLIFTNEHISLLRSWDNFRRENGYFCSFFIFCWSPIYMVQLDRDRHKRRKRVMNGTLMKKKINKKKTYIECGSIILTSYSRVTFHIRYNGTIYNSIWTFFFQLFFILLLVFYLVLFFLCSSYFLCILTYFIRFDYHFVVIREYELKITTGLRRPDRYNIFAFFWQVDGIYFGIIFHLLYIRIVYLKPLPLFVFHESQGIFKF